MDEQEKLEESFDLEDILKEFAGELSEEEKVEAQAQKEEDVLIWNGIFPEQPNTAPWSPEDTVRLDEVTKAVRRQEASEMEQTVAFTPVGQEEQAPEPYVSVPPQEERVEPYSEEWEPEYEQPMGEYMPVEPIIFRPKSRLGELKRRLIAGPEKRYYELTEQGFWKIQMAIALNLLVALFAMGTTALYAFGFLAASRTKFVVFAQFLSLLLSALLGSYQLMAGFADIVKKRFSLDSLLLFSLLASLTDGVLCLQQMRVPCCAVFSLMMTMSLWGAYQRRNTELGQMDTMRKAIMLDSVVRQEDYYEGRAGFLRGEGQVEDFMNRYQDRSGPEKVLSYYALAALGASVIIGVVAGILHGLSFGLQIFASSLLLAVPASAYITLSRPMAILERRFHKLGVVLCGWSGILGLSQGGAFPVRDEDLFPMGAAKLNGVKFFGKREPDEVVAYAAALMGACGGGMAPLFAQLLESRSGHHYDVDEFRGYSEGVGGVINEEAVLAGTMEFMRDMGVDMPESTGVSQAIYVAIDGQLCGVFAISYGRTKSAARGFATLCNYRRLTPVMVGSDFMMTESFLHGKFGVNTRQIAFPNRKTRQLLQEKKVTEQDVALALMTQEGLIGGAYAVTGARAVRTASVLGVTVHMLGGILGMVMMLLLAIVGAAYLLTPANVLLYGLIWMVPGLLITEWTRAI